MAQRSRRLTHTEAFDGDGRPGEALALAVQLADDAERVLGLDHPTAAAGSRSTRSLPRRA
jgi:hypothetical protein